MTHDVRFRQNLANTQKVLGQDFVSCVVYGRSRVLHPWFDHWWIYRLSGATPDATCFILLLLSPDAQKYYISMWSEKNRVRGKLGVLNWNWKETNRYLDLQWKQDVNPHHRCYTICSLRASVKSTTCDLCQQSFIHIRVLSWCIE